MLVNERCIVVNGTRELRKASAMAEKIMYANEGVRIYCKNRLNTAHVMFATLTEDDDPAEFKGELAHFTSVFRKIMVDYDEGLTIIVYLPMGKVLPENYQDYLMVETSIANVGIKTFAMYRILDEEDAYCDGECFINVEDAGDELTYKNLALMLAYDKIPRIMYDTTNFTIKYPKEKDLEYAEVAQDIMSEFSSGARIKHINTIERELDIDIVK